jgi:hypothetical protein
MQMPVKLIGAYVVAVLMATGCCSPVSAGSFTGSAIGLDRAGIPGVTVEAISVAGDIIATATTAGVAGTYTLTVPGTGPLSIRFSQLGRVGTTLDRLSAETVAGKIDVVLPLESEMGIYPPYCYYESAPVSHGSWGGRHWRRGR